MPVKGGKVDTAIVLQGGGALGAYECEVLTVLYEARPGFKPVAAAGISIGAISPAVLGGARDPIPALDSLRRDRLTVEPLLPVAGLPHQIDQCLSAFSNPGMYRLNGRIVDGASAGLPPQIIGLGPVPATRKLLAGTGSSIADISAVELNEASATQSLACIRHLPLDSEIVNNDGGAIALGHALGSSGSRSVITVLGRIERDGAAVGLATMCVGVGQGTAMLIEAL